MAIATPTRTPISRLWDRELDHYPKTGARFVSLGIVVLATIVLYYQFYLAGSLAAGTGVKVVGSGRNERGRIYRCKLFAFVRCPLRAPRKEDDLLRRLKESGCEIP